MRDESTAHFLHQVTQSSFFVTHVKRFNITWSAVSTTTVYFFCGKTMVMQCTTFLIDWLSDRPQVLWLDVIAPRYTATHSQRTSPLARSSPRSTSSDQFPMLSGTGQLVGIADTGVDLSSCFFADTEYVGPQHRKVLQYFAFADASDIPGGHGTAVAGAFVGNCLTNASTAHFNGVVPDARLVVFDMSNTSGKPSVNFGINQPLAVPADVYDIYSPMFDIGVRVLLSAWGSTAPLSESTLTTQRMDEFAWYHRDFLDVRAAGNYGRAYFSLVPEAVAKNVLTVGAVVSSLEDYITSFAYVDLTPNIEVIRDKDCAMNQAVCNVTTVDQCCISDLSQVRDACCPSNILERIKANPALYSPQNVASFSSKGPTRDQRIKPDVLAVGDRVITAKALSSMPYTSTTPSLDSSKESNLMTLSGTSFAAASVAGLATVVRQYFIDGFYPTGLSNALNTKTPSAALMKAMLITSARPVSSFVDSEGQVSEISAGSLLGASFEGGFGSVDLNRVLYFDQRSNFSLFILEGDIATNETSSYCFELSHEYCSSKLELIVTLVWTDYPAFPASVRQLVNDLDLVIIQSYGAGKESIHYGNGPYDTITEDDTADRLNNVEKISVKVTHCPAAFRLNITGYNVPVTCDQTHSNCLPQSFHVVLRGPTGLTQTNDCVECKSNSDYVSCAIANGLGKKRCRNGRYTKCFVSECDEGYTINSYENSCRAFLSYYVIVAIISGIFTLLTAIICIPINACSSRTVKANRSRKVCFWDVFKVIQPQLALVVSGSVCSVIGTSCSMIQCVIFDYLSF